VAETLINLMMSSFLMALRLACHPLMVMPMLLGSYYGIRKIWLRRSSSLDGDGLAKRSLSRTPRLGSSYRSMGSVSSRSTDS
ncbi:hypothetical protein KR222_008365, partial [Zaprionus bogoriensis]